MKNSPYQKYLVVLAVGTFIVNDSKILIVKKSPNERVDGGLWTAPGGKIYQSESIVDGLKRGTEEEVGVKISSYQWIGEDVFENEGVIFHAQHFLCQIEKNDISLEKNLTDFRWITKEEIEKYQFPLTIKERIIEIFDNL
jgi:ADP-ribose pyrophosphatase YjhB (NUDIX family)